MSTRIVAALSASALLVLSGCASGTDPSATDGAGDDRPVVVTDMYPTTFAVQQVVGDAVEVVQLAPPGVEPHEYELTPQQVQQIADADLVAYLPGMIPAVEEAVSQEGPDRAVDVAAGIERLQGAGHEEDGEHADEGGHADEADPHVWLDPDNMASMGRTVATAAEGLAVSADASGLEAQMKDLDGQMSAALRDCTIKDLVTAHEAFAYLAQAYGFRQVGISGVSPEAQPSPAKLAEISQLVRDRGVTTVYFEELLSKDAAEAIAAETGAATALLDPIEGNTNDKGYVEIMRTNADTLNTGQSCS